MKSAGVQAAAGCTILGPSVVFAVVFSDLPFASPRLSGDSEHTYSERSLIMVAGWRLWSCRSIWEKKKKKDGILITTVNSAGVHWGFTIAQPHPYRINLRKIYKTLLFSCKGPSLFCISIKGEEVEKIYLYTPHLVEMNCLWYKMHSFWALGLCILFLGRNGSLGMQTSLISGLSTVAS